MTRLREQMEIEGVPSAAEIHAGEDEDETECAGCAGPFEIADGYEESDHGLCWPCASAELDRANARILELEARANEHLSLIARLSRETPYPNEAADLRSQVRVLIAEVGTLRSKVASLHEVNAVQAATITELRAANPPAPPCGKCGQPLPKNHYSQVPTAQGKMDLCVPCWTDR